MTNITILCANRPRLLKQTLDSIGDLSEATVTIRDAGMNPEVTSVAEKWASGDDKRNIMYSSVSFGTGPARNLVIAKSEAWFGRGDYLYLSDDDVLFHPAWLYTMKYIFPQVKALGFKVLAAYNHPFNSPFKSYPVDFYHAQPLGPNGEHLPDIRLSVGECYAVSTQSMLMDWETWDEFGPFCETPAGKVCQSEDVDFCNRIRSAGYKVGVISPALLVNTGITNSFGEKIVGWEMVKAEAPEGIIVE